MTLHEMKTEQAFEAMVKMLPHVTAILDDEDVMAEKKKIKEQKPTGGQTFSAVMPLMLTRHGGSMIAIVAAACGVDEAAVREMPLCEMQKAFDDAWKDVLGFFPSCLRLVMNA